MTSTKLSEKEIQKLQEDSYWQILELEAKNKEFEEYAKLLTKQQTEMQEINTTLRTEIKKRDSITKELTISREEAERANLAKSEFLANISHELRTPMHAILSYASMGENRGETVNRKNLIRYFETIRLSGKRLLTLLNDLLDLSKLDAGHMQSDLQQQEIGPIIQKVITEQQANLSAAEINIKLEETNLSTTCLFDFGQIWQVMTNLIANAIKFSPEHSIITISFSHIKNKNKQNMLCCSVSDQGIGIPETELESVFDQFIQSSKTATGAGGTGLGLAICKKIITNHGGDIWAENRAGGGTLFRFTVLKEESSSE